MSAFKPSVVQVYLHMASRAEGVSIRELVEHTGRSTHSARSAMARNVGVPITQRCGLDSRGCYSKRYFTDSGHAAAYVYVRVKHANNIQRTINRMDRVAQALVVLGGHATCRQMAEQMGRTLDSVTKTVGIMERVGQAWTALCRCPETRRRAWQVFMSAAERDAWQSANPFTLRAETLRARAPKEPRPVRIKAIKAPKVVAPKKGRPGKELLRRSNRAMSEMLSRRSVINFGTTPRYEGHVLTEAEMRMVQHIPSRPEFGNRGYVADADVPLVFSALRPGQYLEVTA